MCDAYRTITLLLLNELLRDESIEPLLPPLKYTCMLPLTVLFSLQSNLSVFSGGGGVTSGRSHLYASVFRLVRFARAVVLVALKQNRLKHCCRRAFVLLKSVEPQDVLISDVRKFKDGFVCLVLNQPTLQLNKLSIESASYHPHCLSYGRSSTLCVFRTILAP